MEDGSDDEGDGGPSDDEGGDGGPSDDERTEDERKD